MKKIFATLATVALLAGCAGISPSTPAAPPAPVAQAAPDMPTRASDGMLIGPNGKTLYTYAKDGKNTGASECYDQCAVNWPPLPAAATAKPAGDYSIIIRADGMRQWAFKGQPLYYFAKDAKAGDKMGDGLGGNWKIVKP